MLFNSVEFVALVFVTFAIYHAPVFKRLQRPVLVLASFVFYGSSSRELLLLLWASILLSAVTSHLVRSASPRRKVLWASAGVVANLGVLAFFKYGPLIGKTLFPPGGSIGDFLIGIPLPVGISFFTFQGVTLLVDTLRAERGESQLEVGRQSFGRHLHDTTLYIAFFPQLVAGPIVKAHDFFPQICEKRFGDIDWGVVGRNLLTGYFLKMVVADNLRDQTFWIAYPYYESQSSPDLAVMLFGYSMQIFADFAGYSLIAIGVAALFGYRLPANFDFPYVSASIAEFWRRWHLSLSSFLKEYLYIPLGGNRRGDLRTYANLMVVMLLGGLWHGAAWSYMVWGGFHGAGLAVERFLAQRSRLPSHPLVTVARVFCVFAFVTAGWLLFKLPDFAHVIGYFEAMARNRAAGLGRDRFAMIAVLSLPVLVYHADFLLRRSVTTYVRAVRPRFMPLVYGVMLFLLITNSGAAEAFVYFQF